METVMPSKRIPKFLYLLLSMALFATLSIAGPALAGSQPHSLAVTTPVLIKDVNPGTNSGLLYQFDTVEMLPVNGQLYFSGNTDAAGVELWRSDGSAAGTVLVKDINPGVKNAWPTDFASLNGSLVFVANDGTHGNEIWISNGTEAGTVLVKDINPTGSAGPYDLVVSGSHVFFFANDGTNGTALWQTDGTEAGTQLIKQISGYQLTDVNGKVFFEAPGGSGNYDWDLWVSNGTGTGTQQVKDFYWDNLLLLNVDGTLFLAAADSSNSKGEELWTSDGTPGGTVLVKDINPGYDTGSSPEKFTNVNGTLFFVADDGTHGSELWKSDGTPGGTVLVEDIYPGSSSSFNYFCENQPCMANVDGTLFFTANNGANGAELWRSDGSEAGTQMVIDINSGSGNYLAGRITAAQDGLLFFVNGNDSIGTLWVSNGTQADTTLVQLFDAAPALLTTMDGWLYFAGRDSSHGKEPWGLRFTTLSLIKIYLPLVKK
jgi:ELWxxDGT repeat protein